MDKSLTLIVGHANHGDLAKQKSFLAHSASFETQRGSARAASDSVGVPTNNTPRISASATLGTTDLCDYSGRR